MEGGKVVGVDPTVITAGELEICGRVLKTGLTQRLLASAKKLSETLGNSGAKLVSVEQNLVDKVWAEERPPRPNEKVKVHPDKFAGKSFQDKISDLRKELQTKKKAGFVVCE